MSDETGICFAICCTSSFMTWCTQTRLGSTQCCGSPTGCCGSLCASSFDADRFDEDKGITTAASTQPTPTPAMSVPKDVKTDDK